MILYIVSAKEGVPNMIGSIHEKWIEVAPDEVTSTFRGLEGGPGEFENHKLNLITAT